MGTRGAVSLGESAGVLRAGLLTLLRVLSLLTLLTLLHCYTATPLPCYSATLLPCFVSRVRRRAQELPYVVPAVKIPGGCHFYPPLESDLISGITVGATRSTNDALKVCLATQVVY